MGDLSVPRSLNRYQQIMERIFFFPPFICRPIAAQFMENDLIALFEFEEGENGIVISVEKHYRLVPSSELTPADLEMYRSRPMQ